MRRYGLPAFIWVLGWCFTGTVFAGDPATDLASLLLKAEKLYETRDEFHHADQVIALYRLVLEHNAKNDEALWKLSRSYRWRGDQSGLKKEKMAAYKKAKAYAKKAIEANAAHVGGHLMLGIAYGRIGETKGVLKSLFLIAPIKNELRAVLEIDPDNDVAHHVLGILYRKVPGWLGGSLQKSIHYFKKALQENPLRTSHYLELSKTYLKQGKQEKAFQLLKSLLSIKSPEDPVRSKQDRVEAESLLAARHPK